MHDNSGPDTKGTHMKKLDYTSLQDCVAKETEAHLRSLSRKKGMYGYSLVLNDGYDPLTIVAAYNVESAVTHSPNKAEAFCCRYSVDEWKFFDAQQFPKANKVIRSLTRIFKSSHKKAEDDCYFDSDEVKHMECLHKAILAGLASAQKAMDGTTGSDLFMAVWITDSADKIIKRSVKLLNESGISTKFIKYLG